MTQKSKLLPIVALFASVSAMGFSVWSMTEVGVQKDLMNKKLEDLSSSFKHQINYAINDFDSKSLASFESRVEQSLESIVEKRKAKAEEDRRARIQKANAKSDGASTLNDQGQVVYGNIDAPVTIYSFEDFRCSFCEKHHPTVKQYVDMSDGFVNYIIKPYPILGEASVSLAQAGECIAQEEGPAAFIRFADQAYQTKNWRTAIKYSGLLDEDNIEKCVEENRYNDRIMNSLAEGNQLNITGTPASIFRGKITGKAAYIPGFIELGQISQMVQEVASE